MRLPPGLDRLVNRRGPQLNRFQKVLDGIDRTMLGLEIGPAHRPAAPKREGWRVLTVDHTDREGLLRKYAAHRHVDTTLIEEIDIVWTGGPLDEVVVAHGHARGAFDYVIASHVAEHSPDLVGFLGSCLALLRPGGVLSLVLPDKRWCFDLLKPLSTTGDALLAHRQRRTRHSPLTAFTHASLSIKSAEGAGAWDAHSVREVCRGAHFTQPLQQAFRVFQTCRDEPAAAYVDYHAWYFTPASFELMIAELGALGCLSARVRRRHQPAGCEFYVQLEPVSGSGEQLSDQERLRLHGRIAREMCEAWHEVARALG